ncbi:MAG: hypothetical protein U0166_25035 [Acidobacteriota bacterium]
MTEAAKPRRRPFTTGAKVGVGIAMIPPALSPLLPLRGIGRGELLLGILATEAMVVLVALLWRRLTDSDTAQPGVYDALPSLLLGSFLLLPASGGSLYALTALVLLVLAGRSAHVFAAVAIVTVLGQAGFAPLHSVRPPGFAEAVAAFWSSCRDTSTSLPGAFVIASFAVAVGASRFDARWQYLALLAVLVAISAWLGAEPDMYVVTLPIFALLLASGFIRLATRLRHALVVRTRAGAQMPDGNPASTLFVLWPLSFALPGYLVALCGTIAWWQMKLLHAYARMIAVPHD